MIDTTIHLGDVLVAVGFVVGGWRFAFAVRDKMRGLEQTVYGSEQPPVEGLVKAVDRHEQVLRLVDR